MVNFAESVKGALRGGLCNVLAANEGVTRLLAGGFGDPLQAIPFAAGLRRQLCSDDPDNDPSPTPPFTGGQCVGRGYVIDYQFNTVNTDGSSAEPPTVINGGASIAGGIPGPIRGISVEGNPGALNLVITYGAGLKTTLQQSSAPQGDFRNAKIIRARPFDGGVDNCGDPGIPVVPPGPVPMPPQDITYDIDINTEITVPLTAVFAPVFLSFDGSIKVPVTVNVGGLDFDGSVTISPEFEVNIKPSFNFGGPGEPDDPTIIGEPGGGSEPLPEVEDLESTILGVLVYSDIDSEASPSGVVFTNGPNLYVPRLASVQFAVKTRDSIGWTSDQDVKNLECYVPCPAPQGAIAVRVSPMPGVQSRFTPVRGMPLTSF